MYASSTFTYDVSVQLIEVDDSEHPLSCLLSPLLVNQIVVRHRHLSNIVNTGKEGALLLHHNGNLIEQHLRIVIADPGSQSRFRHVNVGRIWLHGVGRIDKLRYETRGGATIPP